MGQHQRKIIFKKRLSHAKRRLKERHGLFLSDLEYCKLIQQIVEGESRFLLRVSNSTTIHRVTHNNIQFPVVYSKRNTLILTVYHNSWIKLIDGKYQVFRKKKKPSRARKKRVPWQLKSKWNRARREELGII